LGFSRVGDANLYNETPRLAIASGASAVFHGAVWIDDEDERGSCGRSGEHLVESGHEI
jgi:hypothetical protein